MRRHVAAMNAADPARPQQSIRIAILRVADIRLQQH